VTAADKVAHVFGNALDLVDQVVVLAQPTSVPSPRSSRPVTLSRFLSVFSSCRCAIHLVDDLPNFTLGFGLTRLRTRHQLTHFVGRDLTFSRIFSTSGHPWWSSSRRWSGCFDALAILAHRLIQCLGHLGQVFERGFDVFATLIRTHEAASACETCFTSFAMSETCLMMSSVVCAR